MNLSGLVFIAIGIFSICGAAFQWNWFMNHYKVRFLTSLFGRSGARAFYFAIGGGMILFGIAMLFGVFAPSD